jgi:6-phosphogluconolactonase
MHARTRIVALCLALLAVAAVVGSGTASAASRVVGHVYVNDNTAGTNTIGAFDRHADGSLTPTPGSPFSVGTGAGTGAGVPSQGALQRSADGRYLLAVDAGSNELSVLRIESNGKLAPVSSMSSNGKLPVSIAVSRSLVYVANGGAGASNYTGFRLSGSGHLSAVANSTYALPDNAQPADVLFNRTGTNLVGTRVSTSQIDSFAVDGSGRLHAAAGSPFAAQGLGPFGSEFRPTNPHQLFVSNAHDGANLGSVSAFRVARGGKLSSIGSSPFADRQTAPCWVEISHDGRFLFTVNTAVPSISRYAINTNGSLRLIGSTVFNLPGGLGPIDARLAPDGHSLFVVGQGANAVSAFKVNRGNLTELHSSPTALPSGAKPFGIVVT